MSADATSSASVTSMTEPRATIRDNSRQNATPCDNSRQNATTVAPASSDTTDDANTTCDSQGTLPRDKNAFSDLFALTAPQEAALELLLRGISFAKVAQHIGVHRNTVHRWKTSHPRFIAELAHRARSSQFETAIRARRTIDLANHIVLNQLIRDPKSSTDLAARILASPRLARLAATDDLATPDLLSRLQSMRQCSDDADPAFLQELSAEINAPIPSAAPVVAPIISSTRRYARRPPRQCLVDALAEYRKNVPESDVTRALVRRPDLHPLDIHYTLRSENMVFSPPRDPQYLAELLRDGPVGITTPLKTSPIINLLLAKRIHHIAGYSLEDYECNTDHRNGGLTLTHKQDKTTIHLPADQLWRDIIIPQ